MEISYNNFSFLILINSITKHHRKHSSILHKMFTSTLWTISKISHLIDYLNTINRFRCFTNTIIVYNSHEFNYCISKIITSIFIHISKETRNSFNIISKFSIFPIFMIKVFSCITFHKYISRTS